jgi:hypothetical protein
MKMSISNLNISPDSVKMINLRTKDAGTLAVRKR